MPLPETLDAPLFCERLLAVRQHCKLSQKELAALTHTVTETGISHFECGRRVPSVENLYQLCKALQCSADYLLGLTDAAKQRQ